MRKRTLCLETIALVAFFSTMPIYSPNIVPLQQCLKNDATMGWFVVPMLVCAAIVSAVFFVFAATRAVRPERPLATYTLCSLASTLGYVACMTYFVLVATGALQPHATAVTLCGVGIGICLPPTAIRWGKRLASLRLRQALFLVCIVCTSTAAINWAFSLLPPTVLAVLYIAMLAFGSFLPCAFLVAARRKRADVGDAAKQENAPCLSDVAKDKASDADRNDEQAASLLIPRFVSVLIPALVGMSVFAFHMGVSRESILDSVSTEILGNVIASLILAPLCFVKSRQPTSMLLFSGAAPVAAAMLLCYMAVANDFGVPSDFISTGIYTFFCMIAQISIALGVAGTHAREFSAPMIWSGFLALFITFSILGLALGGLLSDEQPFMPQTITALYCVYLVAQSVRSLWKSSLASRDGGFEPADEESGYARRCEKLAADFSLSPREKEIAGYLGRGHACPYIAKTLIISESTVYTHSRNIYRKVGIQSKEELIQILTSAS